MMGGYKILSPQRLIAEEAEDADGQTRRQTKSRRLKRSKKRSYSEARKAQQFLKGSLDHSTGNRHSSLEIATASSIL